MGTITFTQDQKNEIDEGVRKGLDVSVYAKPEFLAIQMRQIRLGLQENLPVAFYASPEYDWFQMEEIHKGLTAGIDVKKYANPAIPFDKMRQIRKGLVIGYDLSGLKQFPAGVLRQLRIAAAENIDIRKYIKEGYEEEQLLQIRIAKENGIDIDPYITLMLRGASIREIVLGLEKELDVSVYAKPEMSWQQMREIRLGMEMRLDVTSYQKPLYSWQQMREIRLGLEKNLPVEEYASLMYTAKEMKKRRLALLSGERTPGQAAQEEKEQYRDFVLLIDADWTEAYVMLTKKDAKVHKEGIFAALRGKGVITGIDYQAIEELEEKGADMGMVTVARGTSPSKGKDGWYEYFFETDVKKHPKILENGMVDYQNVKWFETVTKDQKVAYYHEAEEGLPGTRINGEKIPGTKGKELLPLEGRGVVLLEDQKTYLAAMDGKVDLEDGKLEVTNMLVLNDVTKATGNVEFNGSVYVRGMVRDGVVIKAQNDILIDGYTEAATLEAGGDIILRKGNNAGGRGFIKAGASVMGNFFENAKVSAGVDVKANYCLNSQIAAEQNIVISGRKGSLAGGSAQAGQLIESYDIGNEAGLVTRISVGKDEVYFQKKAELEQKKHGVRRELFLLRNAYEDLQKKYPPEIRNTNPMYLKIEDAIYTKEIEQKQLEKDGELLAAEAEKSRFAKIVAHGTIYQGVQVNINAARWNANKTTNVTLKKTEDRVALYKNS